MKIYLIIIAVVSLVSCTDTSGDKYIGKWTTGNNKEFVRIQKAGNGYLVSEFKDYSWVYKNHCQYIDGCFEFDFKRNKIRRVCDDGSGGLISVYTGKKYKKSK